ncbi:MAG TPA: dihydroxyacetone kinase subunit DhaL [Bryobacteraceae bacterium]|jgi:dihydroxyacetone kinase-like protein
MPIGKQDILAWFDALERAYAANRERLTELDSAIGDADHGTNMDRGFTAVQTELAANVPTDIRAALQSAATVLLRTVGGSAGPLYGTFFMRAAASCAGKTELDDAAVVAMFAAGIAGVEQRGKSGPQDKTMLDALLPALSAMQASLRQGGALAAILADAVAAAEKGMLATIPMLARKGRASYLGPRSVGHQDPGATSSYLLIKAAADTWT